MSDLISRQAAMTAIHDAYVDTQEGFDKAAIKINVGLTKALHMLQDLPSAQPEIIRCRDCNYYRPRIDSDIGDCLVHGIVMTPIDYCSMAREKND